MFFWHDDCPILAANVSHNVNVYSARMNTCVAFREDLVDKYSNENPGYTIPGHNVDKRNVVRVAVFDDDGDVLILHFVFNVVD